MRVPLVAGNWKMHLDRASAVALARAVAAHQASGLELAVCPPFVYLDAVGAALAGSSVALGAQNMYHEPSGAFTGETSAAMLLDLGCRYVILGHSERRHILGETDEAVCRKVEAAITATGPHGPLRPIVCVGELLDERQAGRTFEVVERQITGSLAGLSAEQVATLTIAYEPVWAIGTGQVATPEQAEEVHAELRKILAARYNAAAAEQVRILYGGSVKPDNAGALLTQPNIDGALVGGASLKATDFLAIADRAVR